MQRRFPIVIPLLLAGLVILILRMTSLDLHISELFFDRQKRIWPLAHHYFWDFIDLYFIYPGFLMGVAAVAISLYCLIRNINTTTKRAALIISCSFLLGPGLMVNGTMKPIFSRPRPCEVQQFGGKKAYQPVLGFGDRWHFNSSFPSGHAGIGFFMITPAFVLARYRITSLACLVLGLLYGGLMSYSRVVQGGHFFSDVFCSLVVVYMTCWLMATLDLRKQIRKQHLRSEETMPDGPQQMPLHSAA